MYLGEKPRRREREAGVLEPTGMESYMHSSYGNYLFSFSEDSLSLHLLSWCIKSVCVSLFFLKCVLVWVTNYMVTGILKDFFSSRITRTLG